MQERERIPEPPVSQKAGRCSDRRTVQWRVDKLIAEQDWLEPIAAAVQRVAGNGMGLLGRSVTDLLHGTWLRHPLHAALTDAPIGAWTAAFTLDVVDLAAKQPRAATAADAAVAIGVATAIPTALSGMADWRHVYGHPRRVGLVHAALNTAGLLCQIASLVFRLRGKRRPGVGISMLGYLSTTLAAWLGGTLVYEEGVGVDHTAFQEGPKDFVAVLPENELEEGRLTKVQANGMPVMLLREGSQIFAIGETCAHQGGPLAKGRLHEGVVTCPWHGSQFRIREGTLVHGPATFDQPCFETRVRDGQIEVRRGARMA